MVQSLLASRRRWSQSPKQFNQYGYFLRKKKTSGADFSHYYNIALNNNHNIHNFILLNPKERKLRTKGMFFGMDFQK